MILNRTEKVYPRQVIERIVGGQMRLVPEDGDLYENAVRNVYAAFDIAEQYTNRILVRSVVTFAFDRFVQLLDLLTAPVLRIRSVRYCDADDREQTLDPSLYQLLASEHTAALEFFTLPTLSARRRMARVRVEAICGYSDYRDTLTREPEDDGGIILPGNIEAAVALRAGTLCEADGDAVIGRSVTALPVTVERLLNPYRMTPYVGRKG